MEFHALCRVFFQAGSVVVLQKSRGGFLISANGFCSKQSISKRDHCPNRSDSVLFELKAP